MRRVADVKIRDNAQHALLFLLFDISGVTYDRPGSRLSETSRVARPEEENIR